MGKQDHTLNGRGVIAYFSMEIGIDTDLPTYSGGLGILAGDTIRSAADMRIPMVAVTLIHRKGYFHQNLDAGGWQTELPEDWVVEDQLDGVDARVSVTLENREVHLRAWRYEVSGRSGFKVPVFFLDSDVPENTEGDRTLTHYLYGGDQHYRLCQEAILSMGGVRLLRALGFIKIRRFHMNEGHSSLLTLELLRERLEARKKDKLDAHDIAAVRRKCVFTTHTPVPAGHDKFPLDLVSRVLGAHWFQMGQVFLCDGMLNLTHLALNLSHYVNGVARKHREISQRMFPTHRIDAITNGVHAATWTAQPFQELFNRYFPRWREDNSALRSALTLPKEEVWKVHLESKEKLLRYTKEKTGIEMDKDTLTLGFARRATAYKRADLLFHDMERLKRIASEQGALQLVYAGKAHPHDGPGKELIKRIHQASEAMRAEVKIAYLDNYNMALGKLITSGVDVWLNTPEPPLEASGTSGMKAALNGIPSLSILDGWWIEGCVEGVTGWAIGSKSHQADKGDRRTRDAQSLYEALETKVVPCYYGDRNRFIDIMLHAIALNGSFFNTQRMMQQYVLKAYYL